MEPRKRRRGRPATGRSFDSLEQEKLSRAIWCGSRNRVWITKRVHHTWKVLKSAGLFNTDSDFAAHLLSLEMARRQRLNKKGMEVVRLARKTRTTKKSNGKKDAPASDPVTSTPSSTRTGRSKRSLFSPGSPEMSPSPCVVRSGAANSKSQCLSVSDSDDSLGVVDITGSFINSFEEDGDDDCKLGEEDEGENDTGGQSCQILDGSVIVTPSKAFHSDSSESLCKHHFIQFPKLCHGDLINVNIL